MVVLLIILTWLLIFIASRESIPFNKRRYVYVGAIIVSVIAMTVSIMNLVHQLN